MQATRDRPVGVIILTVIAGVLFVLNAVNALLFLGALPITLFGRTGFFGQALLGAILYGIVALIYGWLTIGLWNLDPQAWLFVVLVTILNLILAAVSVLGATSLQEILPTVIANVVILVYSLSPGVKEAFGQPGYPTRS